MKLKHIITFLLFLSIQVVSFAANKPAKHIPAAHLTHLYVPAIQNLKVALVVNQTSTIYNKHLVDSLLKLGIHIEKIFAPEHGFRGDVDAGNDLPSSIDS